MTISDTTPEAESKHLEMLRGASPEVLWRMWEQINTATRSYARAGLRERFPDASNREIERRLASLTLGETLAEQALGPVADYAE